jgi:hypothetical protein
VRLYSSTQAATRRRAAVLVENCSRERRSAFSRRSRASLTRSSSLSRP